VERSSNRANAELRLGGEARALAQRHDLHRDVVRLDEDLAFASACALLRALCFGTTSLYLWVSAIALPPRPCPDDTGLGVLGHGSRGRCARCLPGSPGWSLGLTGPSRGGQW
jgi:hypothetical protein